MAKKNSIPLSNSLAFLKKYFPLLVKISYLRWSDVYKPVYITLFPKASNYTLPVNTRQALATNTANCHLFSNL